MPSPFPGMNPYLEQNDTWQDFHNSFLVHARESLARLVGPNYLVKVEVRLLVHDANEEENHLLGVSDIGLISPDDTVRRPSATALLEAPVHLQLPKVIREREVALEIRDRRNRRIVTVIEMLSPSNKTVDDDRNDYVAKRRRLLASPSHFVEIDLLRGGRRPSPPELPACDYYALVSRYEDRPSVSFWPLSLREPLPVIPIPLDQPDVPVYLDLKAVLDQTYDAADYGKYIYQETPIPPLSAADEAWARSLIPNNYFG